MDLGFLVLQVLVQVVRQGLSDSGRWVPGALASLGSTHRNHCRESLSPKVRKRSPKLIFVLRGELLPTLGPRQ